MEIFLKYGKLMEKSWKFLILSTLMFTFTLELVGYVIRCRFFIFIGKLFFKIKIFM